MTLRAPPSGRLLYGVRAIAEFLGVKPRQALHLIEQGLLPVFRQGRVICSTRAALDVWLVKQEAEALAATTARPLADAGALDPWSAASMAIRKARLEPQS